MVVGLLGISRPNKANFRAPVLGADFCPDGVILRRVDVGGLAGKGLDRRVQEVGKAEKRGAEVEFGEIFSDLIEGASSGYGFQDIFYAALALHDNFSAEFVELPKIADKLERVADALLGV